MQRLEVSGAVRPIYGSLGVKRISSELIFAAPSFCCGSERFLRILCANLRWIMISCDVSVVNSLFGLRSTSKTTQPVSYIILRELNCFFGHRDKTRNSTTVLFVCFLALQPPPPQWARASSFTRFLDNIQHTLGRTPLDE